MINKSIVLVVLLLQTNILFSQQTTIADSITNIKTRANKYSVKGGVLKNTSPTNVLSALTGRFSGVKATTSTGNFGGGSKILIRGRRAYGYDNQPLYIVNGIPISNADYSSIVNGSQQYDFGNLAVDLNLWDIDSISIIPPSKSSIYGYRGSNGVVVIETQKGELSDSFKIGITYNSSISFDKISTYPKYQKQYGGGYSNSFETVNIGGVDYLVQDYETDESWGPKYNSSVYVLPWNAFDSWDTQHYLKAVPWIYPKHDYTYFFKTATGFQNNIQITASSKFLVTKLAYTNLQQSGVIPNCNSKRNYLSFNTNIKFKELARFNVGFTYLMNKTTGRPAITWKSYNNVIGKLWTWTQTSLDYKDLKSYINPDGTQRSWNRTSWNNSTPKYQNNPYWSRYKNTENDDHNRFYLNSSIDLNLTKWLCFSSKLGIEKYTYNIYDHTAIGSINLSEFAYDKINYTETNLDVYVSANKRFIDNKIGIKGIIGKSFQIKDNSMHGGHTNGGLIVPYVYSLMNSTNAPTLIEYDENQNIGSLYSTIDIDYKQFFSISMVVRKDKANNIKTSSFNYEYQGYSNFVIKSMLTTAFYCDFDLIKFGLFTDYSTISSINLHANFTNHKSSPNPQNSIGLYLSTLKHEINNQSELGFELGLFNNRLFFDMNYYYSNILNQIYPISINSSTGYNYKLINLGSYYTKGLEFSILANVLDNSNINWNISFNLSTLNSKIKSIADDVMCISVYDAYSNGYIGIAACKGESFPIIYGTDYIYDSKGNKIVHTDGTYCSSEVKPLAKVTPNLMGGFTSSLDYKGFSLSFLIDFQKGGHTYYESYGRGMASGILSESAKNNENGINIREPIANGGGVLLKGAYGYYDYSTERVEYLDESGNASSVPIDNNTRITGREWTEGFSTGPQVQNVFSTDFIKLREISISYVIPRKTVKCISEIKVSLFGRNLTSWRTATKHFDPEYIEMTSSSALGFESGYLPSTRTFGCMLNMSF